MFSPNEGFNTTCCVALPDQINVLYKRFILP
jgi:hypothetical protein